MSFIETFLILLTFIVFFFWIKSKICPKCKRALLKNTNEMISTIMDENKKLQSIEIFYYKCNHCKSNFNYVKTTIKNDSYNKYILYDENEVSK